MGAGSHSVGSHAMKSLFFKQAVPNTFFTLPHSCVPCIDFRTRPSGHQEDSAHVGLLAALLVEASGREHLDCIELLLQKMMKPSPKRNVRGIKTCVLHLTSVYDSVGPHSRRLRLSTGPQSLKPCLICALLLVSVPLVAFSISAQATRMLPDAHSSRGRCH